MSLLLDLPQGPSRVRSWVERWAVTFFFVKHFSLPGESRKADDGIEDQLLGTLHRFSFMVSIVLKPSLSELSGGELLSSGLSTTYLSKGNGLLVRGLSVKFFAVNVGG